MMKRIVVVVICLCCMSSVYAQWSVTPEAGITAVNPAGSERWNSSFKFGASVEYDLNDFFTLKSGLLYTKRAETALGMSVLEREDEINEVLFYGYDRNRGYLQLPLMLKIGWNISEDIRLSLGAGAYAAYRVKTSGTGYGIYNNGGYGYSEYGNGGYGAYGSVGYWPEGVSNNVRKLDWGATLSVGIEVKQWVMNLGYDLSLGKINKYDSIGANFHTISLSLGYKFRL